MDQRSTQTRRTFLRNVGLSATSLTLGCYWVSTDKAIAGLVPAESGSGATVLMNWISIDESGQITLFNHRSEMGQGTFQAIPQIIAEELEVSMERVDVQYVPASPDKFGPQPQEGSFSIRGWYDQLLRMGASAREMLIEAASKRWKVPRAECYAKDGQVIHRPTGLTLEYKELVKEAAVLTPPEDVPLKSRKDYTQIGKPQRRKDTAAKVNGTAVFGMDVKIPGMLYAVVERSPRIRGKVKRIDDTQVMAVRGVKKVFKVDRVIFGVMFEGVAIVADTLWTAMQARKLLKVEWDDSTFEHLDSEALLKRMHDDLAKPTPSDIFETSLQNCSTKVDAIYELPFQSHSCMEPLNCTADVRSDSITIWGPIQEANWIQADLSERFNTPKSNVSVNMTFLGGGFGRKGFTDYPYEAAMISKEMKAPVQVVWSSEDDMTMGPFRGGGVYRCRGGLNAQKKISAFQVITSGPGMGPGQDHDAKPHPMSQNNGELPGLLTDYYSAIPHYSFGGISTKFPIPTMWWRAPGANTAAFAGESFIDELAHAAGQDPLQFRSAHLVSPRYVALVEKLRNVSKWPTRKKGEGWGVAITDCFGGIVGQVVRVSRNASNKVTIDKVFAVIDCGIYVNPDIIRAQIEGSIVMAMGASVFHGTHFKDGRAIEKNFNSYRMPRIGDIPEIEVHIMENEEKPGGVGEPGLPAFAPALCNALYDLTGKRVRTLPFALIEV
ncbi:molybdopterin cofactor-binding domain-containing protein [Chryseolinea sp. T2]|uniref:xanthine dehydrogenase family protein molybdopterin-binding subunit n=1 Tax=Chryseolinea sp. T2 TaxID=3129255 RepID=UPI00307753D0